MNSSIMGQEDDKTVEDVERVIEREKLQPNDQITLYSTMINLCGQNPALLFERSSLLLSHGCPLEALRDINKSIEIDPTVPQFYGFRSLILIKINQVQLALQDIERVFSFSYTSKYTRAATLTIKGIILSNLEPKQYNQAIQHFTEATLLEPTEIYPLMQRAETYVQTEQLELAVQDYTKIIQLKQLKMKAVEQAVEQVDAPTPPESQPSNKRRIESENVESSNKRQQS